MKLPLYLYPEPPRHAVDHEKPTDVDHACRRCTLSTGVKTVCMNPEGASGGLLVVGMYPGREEDARGRPLVARVGGYVRKLVTQWWDGPVALANAVSCAPGSREVTEKMVDACRTYLAAVVREVKPARVVSLGEVAALGLLGHTVAALTTRRAHAWLGGVTPVLLLPNPAGALSNRFVRAAFEEDLHWALTCALTPPRWKSLVTWPVEDAAMSEEADEAMRAAAWAAWDVETAGEMYSPSFRVLSVSATPKGSDESFTWTSRALANTKTRERLLAWLVDETAGKVAQNEKFDRQAIHAAYGVWPSGSVLDTRLARKLLEPEGSAKLAHMADLVGLGGHKGDMADAKDDAVAHVRRRLAQEKKDAKSNNPSLSFIQPELVHTCADATLDEFVRRCPEDTDRWVYGLVPKRVLHRYNARDSYVTALLAEQFQQALAATSPGSATMPDLARTWDTLVRPASQAIAKVEAWGVAAELDQIEAFDDYLVVRLRELQKKLDLYAPGVNWSSPKQVGELLFVKLGLPVVAHTPSGAPSTDEAVLEALKARHPLPAVLLEFRNVDKLRGTYGAGMAAHVRADGRIHSSYNIDGARSGRTSSSDPNLQNIPSEKTDPLLGKMARDVFVAPRGHVLVSHDYDQIELRVGASVSGDPVMQRIFLDGHDYHRRTAELISLQAWGIPPEQVGDKERRAAKTINFGLAYGMGDVTLAERIGCTPREAARAREAIMGTLRVYDAWSKARVHEANVTGATFTYDPFDPTRRARRRPLWRVADPDSAARSQASNGAFNTPVQGTASDYLIASLIAVVDWIETTGAPAKAVLPVHDQIVSEVREDLVEEYIETVTPIFESWPCAVPLKVSVETGARWGSLTKWKKVP